MKKVEYREQIKKMKMQLEQQGLVLEENFCCFKELEQSLQDILVLTDDFNLCNQVVLSGGYVIAFLHEENRNQDFSTARYVLETLEELDKNYFIRVYQRLTNQPWDILETNRLIVRETIEQDLDAFYNIYSEASITRYTENLFDDREEERKYIRDYQKYVYQFYEFGIWTVLDKNTKEVIGRAGIDIRDGFQIPEIGFIIGKSWQKRGLAFEVCTAILKYAKEDLQLDEIQAFVHPKNKASIQLCKKLGFCMEEEVTIGNLLYLQFIKNLKNEI